jgi:hypothetical protein
MESTETIFLEVFAYRRFFWCYHFYSNNHEVFHIPTENLETNLDIKHLKNDFFHAVVGSSVYLSQLSQHYGRGKQQARCHSRLSLE